MLTDFPVYHIRIEYSKSKPMPGSPGHERAVWYIPEDKKLLLGVNIGPMFTWFRSGNLPFDLEESGRLGHVIPSHGSNRAAGGNRTLYTYMKGTPVLGSTVGIFEQQLRAPDGGPYLGPFT